MAIPAQVRRPAGIARRAVNRRRNAVRRALHPDAQGLHLVHDPVFLLSPVRSGSTLLRSILNSHSAICAPHEMHLMTLSVGTDKQYALDSWEALGLDTDLLANVLWDRVLHLNLTRSGKRVIVDKTPQNARIWKRIHEFWPDARYLHLRRHPAAILRSLERAQEHVSRATHLRTVTNYGTWLDEARDALPGPTVRYEDLLQQPAETMREVCRYLGVRFQPSMLEYRSTNSRAGLGDWSDAIRSGRIQPLEELPEEADVPEELLDLTRRWGY
ncbi:sulfotransferase family protein [Jatrophihabitans fulvus]